MNYSTHLCMVNFALIICALLQIIMVILTTENVPNAEHFIPKSGQTGNSTALCCRKPNGLKLPNAGN